METLTTMALSPIKLVLYLNWKKSLKMQAHLPTMASYIPIPASTTKTPQQQFSPIQVLYTIMEWQVHSSQQVHSLIQAEL